MLENVFVGMRGEVNACRIWGIFGGANNESVLYTFRANSSRERERVREWARSRASARTEANHSISSAKLPSHSHTTSFIHSVPVFAMRAEAIFEG